MRKKDKIVFFFCEFLSLLQMKLFVLVGMNMEVRKLQVGDFIWIAKERFGELSI